MKCSKCSQEAVYFRKHEGNNYCINCFCRQIERAFKKNIRGYLIKNDKMFVKDGVGKEVLLYLLKNTLKHTSFKISKTKTHSKIIDPITSDEKAELFLKAFLFEKYKIAKNNIRATKPSNKLCLFGASKSSAFRMWLTIEPLSNILKDEIKLYAKFKKIKCKITEQETYAEGVKQREAKSKKTEDKKLLEIKEILNELEEKRPGTKMQIAKYVEKIK